MPFSSGRLTAVRRGSESLDFRYDRFGRLTRDGNLTYGYDKNDRRRTIGYPGGVSATYGFDYADRHRSLTLRTGGDPPVTLATDAVYEPSGPLAGVTLGNGLAETRLYDARYLPASIEVAGRLAWSYQTDAMGNITGITDQGAAPSSRAYGYQDYQYYLTSGTGPWGAHAWTYDRAGNRLTETRDGATSSYSYVPNAAGGRSQRLASVLGDQPDAVATRYFYDAAGQLITSSSGDAKVSYRYNTERRLSQILSEPNDAPPVVTTLSYDGRSFLDQSRRTPLLGSAAEDRATRPTYSSEGLLYHRAVEHLRSPAAERDAAAVAGDDYLLHFAGRPLAQLSIRAETPIGGPAASTSELLYLSTDHLGTPVLATDAAGATAWAGGFDPNGSDYASASEAGVFLRFPGQWDDETWSSATAPAGGLYYNVYRWYGPETGGYTRPDPDFYRDPTLQLIYGYGLNRPTMETDPLGLKITAVDARLLDFFVCIAKEARDKTREALSYVGGPDPVPWEIRVSDPSQMATRESIRNYEYANPGGGSTTERPGFWGSNNPDSPWGRRPGRMWIDLRRPLDCVPIVTSMVHELWHAYQEDKNPAKPGDTAHREAKKFDRKEAMDICCRCGLTPEE